MNESNAQNDVSGELKSFDSDGFTLNGSGGGGEFNANSGTYAAWNWKAGGASAFHDGTIASTVSFSTTTGFSVVTHTGKVEQRLRHGLNAVSRMIIH